MKHRIPSTRTLRAHRILAAGIAALLTARAAHAAALIFTVTTPDTAWTTSIWSSDVTTISAGDVAQWNTAGTASFALDTAVTLGELQTGTTTGAIWNLTAGGGTFTLDGTGMPAANQAFGN